MSYNPTMNIYVLACTRGQKDQDSETFKKLQDYFLFKLGQSDDLKVHFTALRDEQSIFDAYSTEVKKLILNDEDIVIFCHDDIEILSDPSTVLSELVTITSDPLTAFVGVAGGKKLGKDAIWWGKDEFMSGKLRGLVMHGKSREDMTPSWYGGPFRDNVVVLDGLFLAISGRNLKKISLDQPKNYKGNWDFFDIYITHQAWEMGFNNKVAPILIRHESGGESMFTRPSWNENRLQFIRDNFLPVSCK